MRSQATFWTIRWMAGLMVMGGVSAHFPGQAQGASWEHYMAEGTQAYQNGQKPMRKCFIWRRLAGANAGPKTHALPPL